MHIIFYLIYLQFNYDRSLNMASIAALNTRILYNKQKRKKDLFVNDKLICNNQGPKTVGDFF